jgi:hypothetical protein
MGKQFVGATHRLLVIERLIVGQRVAHREDVNPSIHIYMDQTGQLEISGHREDDRKGLPVTIAGVVTQVEPSKMAGSLEKPGHPTLKSGRTWAALRKVTVCVSSA